MPSFDVVSKVQMHEVDNALLQASKEIATRYDFRDTNTSVERTDEGIVLRSSSEGRLEAALNVLQEKLVRRKVSLKAIDVQDVEKAGGSSLRQLVKLNQGISTEKAKEVVKFLKGSGLKVLAVTVLTSYDDIDLAQAGYSTSVEALVARRAQQAHDLGMDGLVCSPEEALPLRLAVGNDMLFVTPGIRPVGAAHGDQKRVATPTQAIDAGADYLVVGRPITAAADPKAAAEAVVAEIAAAAGA